MLTKVGVEQRRFSRIPFKKAVRFRPKDLPVFSSHLAQDISQGGLRINSLVFIPLGTILDLQIKLEDEGQLLDMRAKVMWIKYLAHLDQYQVGVEFMGEVSYGRVKIAQHVSKSQ